MTKYDIADAIAANVKTGKWLSCHFTLTLPDGEAPIGVKAFGKWVQIIEFAGMRDGIPEQRTIKGLKAEVVRLIENLCRSAGYSEGI